MTAADAFVILGVLLLTTGLALWSVAAALIVLGVLLLAAGLWSHHSTVAAEQTVPAEEVAADAVGGFDVASLE